MTAFPVIDVFAGAGGLGEGFAAVSNRGRPRFNVALSIEKDPTAHRTLELRHFFRAFPKGRCAEDYYEYVSGNENLSREELFERYPDEAAQARDAAWWAELGKEAPARVDRRISWALNGHSDWVLIGGPPCQAYSVAGRSRNKGRADYTPETDNRHFLYKEYLRIIACHWPAVFVMENVKGILSSRVENTSVFGNMLEDLSDPIQALPAGQRRRGNAYRYRLFSLTTPALEDLFGIPAIPAADYIIESEKYGVPQARHRVILLGIRDDISVEPRLLQEQDPVTVREVLDGLPRLRSGLTRYEDDDAEKWVRFVSGAAKKPWISQVEDKAGRELKRHLVRTARSITSPPAGRGDEFIKYSATVGYRPDWFLDPRLKGVLNSSTRNHLKEDLYRYLYAACFAEQKGRSPRLSELPEALYPEHANVSKAMGTDFFADRFRVQLADQPATTVVSHISKDGHYYIHYDPAQCRSLTVREAARLQTFPDNYFFCGFRTEQYIQVGNAVPPLLSCQIAEIVHDVLRKASTAGADGRQAVA